VILDWKNTMAWTSTARDTEHYQSPTAEHTNLRLAAAISTLIGSVGSLELKVKTLGPFF